MPVLLRNTRNEHRDKRTVPQLIRSCSHAGVTRIYTGLRKHYGDLNKAGQEAPPLIFFNLLGRVR
jgi:hypothetical protein